MDEQEASQKDWAKFSGIYSVFTDEEVRLWVSSEGRGERGDLKLPRETITVAFREAERDFEQLSGDAELEMNTDGCVAIPQLSELLSELIWRVVGGTLPKEVAVKYLASEHPFEKRLGATAAQGEGNNPDWRVTPPAAEILCDTLWGVDAMVRGSWTASKAKYFENLKQNSQWIRLCSLVESLKAQKILPEKLLLARLTEEILVGSGIISPPTILKGKKNPTTVLSRTMLRKNTEMLYKQHRFNLQREETEGFAKLLVLLSDVRDGNHLQAEENMRRLIGYFDLDPNRSLDLTLDALESDPSNRGLLRLVGRFSKDSLPHVVGFKLRHYRDSFVRKVHRARAREALNKKEIDAVTYRERMEKVTSRSLYVVIAVLLSTEYLSLEGLLRHVSPGVASLAAKEREYMDDLERQLSKSGSRVVQLDEAGRLSVGGSAGGNGSGANADNPSKLGSMGPLSLSGSSGGMGGSGSLYVRDRDREFREREAARDRDARRRGGDTSVGGAKTTASRANLGPGTSGGGDPSHQNQTQGQDEEVDSAGKDNQLFGVLEALLDLRAWKVASEVLEKLGKAGVDALRDSNVREALKRLVGAALDGLATRFAAPVKLCPGEVKKTPLAPASATAFVSTSINSSSINRSTNEKSNGNSSSISTRNPVTSLVSPSSAESPEDMHTDEAEAGEVIPQQKKPLLKAASSQSNSLARATVLAVPPVIRMAKPKTPSDLESLKKLPGYGSGFLCSSDISEAVAVLGPYLKMLGPHLGRDPIMFARACRVLSRVNAPNPMAIGATGNKTKGSNNRSENQNQNAVNFASNDHGIATPGDDSRYSCLKGFRSLMGLSVREVQQLFDRAEAERKKINGHTNSKHVGGAAAVKGELDRRKAAYMRVVRTVAPALGMMHGNPAMQGEVWGMLEHLPYEDRFQLYGAWRGHGMERQGLGLKHPQYVVAEIASGAEVSRLIKTLTSDNVRDMARKLGKSSHGQPLIFAEKVLNQLESYDNFITMVVDSLRFVGHALGLDCVAYTMVQHISQTNRSFVSGSGLDLERWVTNLSTFAGLLYRKHPETDCQALLCWAVRSLGGGGEAAMAAGKVLREVLHQAGGVQVLDGWSITQAQVDGKGGGDVLRQENASFGSTVKPLRNARKSLQDDMEKAGVALPLLIFPAIQTEALLYVGGSMDDQMKGRPVPHLKVLGHRSDETHTTMLQASEFVCSSKAWIKNKCPRIETLLKTYKLQPRVAFHIWRPVINENLMKHWFPKTGTKTEKDQREESEANRFIEELETAIPSMLPHSRPLSAKLLLVFWALSLADVYIPTKKYGQVVTNMNEAKRRAENKLLQAERGEVTLSKAEKTRYVSDKKTCPVIASKLETEKAVQSQHVKKVKSKLREIKATLFTDGKYADTIDAILKHLVGHRLGMGPEEAYFCSKFLNTLHFIEAPHFNSLLFYSRSFECLSVSLLCKTQYEAAGLGFFLKDLLENVKEWRSGKSDAIYTMEAGTKHGFNLGLQEDTDEGKGSGDAKGKHPQLTHKQFAAISGTWSMQVTKSLLAAVESHEFLLIKSGLIMFNKMIETFPVSLQERKMLFASLEPMTDKSKEPRDDIRVPCTRIVTQLKKQIAEAPLDPVSHTQPPAQPPAHSGQSSQPKAKGQQGSSGVLGAGAGSSGTPKGSSAVTCGNASSTTGNTSKSNIANTNNSSRAGASSAVTTGGAERRPTALSAKAKPFVPPGPSTSAGGSGNAKAPTSKAASAGAKGSQSPRVIVKKEPSVSVTIPTVSTGSAGAAKRNREASTPSPSTSRPTKTSKTSNTSQATEQGEIVPQRPGADSSAGSSGKGKVSGGATTQAKQLSRDPKAAQTTGPSSGGSSPIGRASAKPSSAASVKNPAGTSASSAPASVNATPRIMGGGQQKQQQQHQKQHGRAEPGGPSQSGVRVVGSRSSGGTPEGTGAKGGREGRVQEGEREVDVRTRDRTREGAAKRPTMDEDQAPERPSLRGRDSSLGSSSRGMGTLAVRAVTRGSRDLRGPASRSSSDGSGGGSSGRVPVGGRGSPTEQEQLPSGSGGGRRIGGRDLEGREDARSMMGGAGVGRGLQGTGSRGVDGLRYSDEGRPQRSEEAFYTRGGSSIERSAGGGLVGRFDSSRPMTDSWHDSRVADSARGGGGMTRGSKRDRSLDSDRGMEEVGYSAGDPSQAFDGTRMRQTDMEMLEPTRSSVVEGWGRGYDDGSSPPGGSDGEGGRYRDDGGGRHEGLSGRMQISPREAAMYDGRDGRGRVGGRQGSEVDGGESVQRDFRGRDQSDDMNDLRSTRGGRDVKKLRDDRQRSSHSRDRKDRKKSSKSKKRKH